MLENQEIVLNLAQIGNILRDKAEFDSLITLYQASFLPRNAVADQIKRLPYMKKYEKLIEEAMKKEKEEQNYSLNHCGRLK